MFRAVRSLMMEAVHTSETSVDNQFTRQYNPEDSSEHPKEVFKAKFEGVSSVGKSRKRWEDVVQQDAASFLCCRNWKLAANDRRTLWRQKIEEAKARFGL
jgi:hypothetical protein